MDPYRIDRIRPGDGERYRAIRLQMLQDTPMAYLETYADALAVPASAWEVKAARRSEPGSTGYAAVDTATGEWVGTMGGFVSDEEPDLAWLVGVWVHPDHRGPKHGLADGLLAAVVAWARNETAVARLRLEVHEANARAIGYYERSGFVRTGVTVPYPLDPAARELEMEREL
jgi:RimJ/RimL family protein N-acetyltransferase